MSSAILPPSVQQSGDVRPSAAEGAVPTGGAVLTGLKVVERSAPDAPGGVARGVLIEGKFYPVELPADVREGARVDVKVTTSAAGVPQLSFVGRTQQPEASANSNISNKVLESLFKTFDLNQQTVETLKQALLPLVSRETAKPNQIQIPQILRQLLKDSHVPELRDLRDPSVTSARVGVPTDSPVRDFLAKAVGARMLTIQSTLGGRASELMRLVIKELEVSDLKTADRSSGSGSKPASVVDRRGVDKETTAQLLKSVAPNFDSIVNKMATQRGETRSAREASMRVFSDLLGAQLEAVRTFESRFRVLLGEKTAPDPISQLLVALKDLGAAVENDTTPLGEQIRTFVKEFSTEIERALAHFEDSLALRKVLEKGLRTLYDTFKLTPLIERFINISGDGSEIPPALKGSFRFIETQLVALLSDPDFDQKISELFQSKGEAFLGKLQQLYREVETTLKQHPEDLRSPRFTKIVEGFEEAKRVLAQILDADQHGEKPTAEQVKSVLQSLRNAIAEVPAREYEGEFISRLNPKNPSETVQRIVRNVERLLIELLPHEAVVGDYGADPISDLEKLIFAGKFNIPREIPNFENGAPREPHRMEFQNLRALLKQLAIELPATGEGAESEMLDATFNFIDQLDASERNQNQRSPALKETAQRALQLFRAHLERRELGNGEGERLSLVDTETLNRVSQLVTSQDTLLHMIPVIKSLGEPVLMLFPFIIGGLLTRGQISFSPPSHDNRDDCASDGNGGGAELFSRIKISLPLPSLGDVLVDVAFRSGEILINFGLENGEAAIFFESRCVELRRILQGLGYTKIQISVVEMSRLQSDGPLTEGSPLESLWGASSAVG